jgi:hypothetical protein
LSYSTVQHLVGSSIKQLTQKIENMVISWGW